MMGGMATTRAFYDPGDFPSLPKLREQWQVIRDELARNAARVVEIPSPQYELMAPGSTWRKLQLYAWGLPVKRNLDALPATAAAIQDVPKLTQAAFYILGARSHLLPHQGVTDRVLRCHIGISCPDGCALRIASETRAETNGGILVFDDTLEHEAWNRSDQDRYVLHLDFLRPEVPLDESARQWMKDLRLRIFQSYPRILPHALGAGVEPDPETIHWFRRMNLSFQDRGVYTDEEWRRFLDTVYPGGSELGPTLLGP
jgi:beta-hydroxylase